MALSTLLLSIPFALGSAIWLYALKGWPVIEAVLAYSFMGTGTLLLFALFTMFKIAKAR